MLHEVTHDRCIQDLCKWPHMFLPYASKINSVEPKLLSCAHSGKKREEKKREGKMGGDWVKNRILYVLVIYFYGFMTRLFCSNVY